MKKIRCPKCGEIIEGKPAISQLDNKTKLCCYCADLEIPLIKHLYY